MNKEILRLLGDHLQKSHLKHGPQSGKLVACRYSKHHPHYPDSEQCQVCDQSVTERLGKAYYEWVVQRDYGAIVTDWKSMHANDRAIWVGLAERRLREHQSTTGTNPDWLP